MAPFSFFLCCINRAVCSAMIASFGVNVERHLIACGFSGSMNAPMLNIHEATRQFGGLTAVDSVSFGVEAGEIFGVIGPNGAGKTTFFNLVSGAISLSSGK